MKQRYPSYRDLKNGKISTLNMNGMSNSNVYVIPPSSYDKTQVKCAECIDQSDINQNAINHHNSSNLYEHQRVHSNGIQRHESNASASGMNRPATVYNDDDSSRLSDLEEEINDGNNWRLYSHDCNNMSIPFTHTNPTHLHLQQQHLVDTYDVNRSLRDMHVLNRQMIPIPVTRQHSLTLPNGLVATKRKHASHHLSETNL
jgi:hypothetical protein